MIQLLTLPSQLFGLVHRVEQAPPKVSVAPATTVVEGKGLKLSSPAALVVMQLRTQWQPTLPVMLLVLQLGPRHGELH